MCIAAATTFYSGVSLASNQAQAASVRWTFDGHIGNNSLTLSPDERTVVLSDSQAPALIVYDMASGKARAVLEGLVTPRNLVVATLAAPTLQR